MAQALSCMGWRRSNNLVAIGRYPTLQVTQQIYSAQSHWQPLSSLLVKLMPPINKPHPMLPSSDDPHFSKPLLVRLVLARPRLLSSLAVGILMTLCLPDSIAHQTVTRAIIGWNAGAIVYLIAATQMMFWSTHERMRARALQHDEGGVVVIVLVITAALMCIGAIVAELGVVKDLKGELRYYHMILAGLTIASSWAFTQTMFALHYAHKYYVRVAQGQPGGLDFPGGQLPDYSDFLYFSCVIGTSGQTADVSFTSRRMRKIGLTHCVLAFFFNTTLVALTINIASGLF